jgi:hypothetical protein
MKVLLAIVVISAALLASCELRAKNKAAKTPPTPAVTTAEAKPAAPPPLLSVPQTDVQLPPAQPLTPEAIATIQTRPEVVLPEPPPLPKTTVRAATKPAPPPAPAPKPEVVPPPAEPPVATPPPEEQVRLQPVYSEEEKRRILGDIERRKGEIENLTRPLSSRRLTTEQRTMLERIRSFLAVVDDAARRGDLRSADSLSERALIFARELGSGR